MAYGSISLGNMQYQPSWQKLLQDLQQSGIAIDPSQTGGFAPRTTKFGTPSLHASGRAMDVNSNANPEGYKWNWEPAKPGSNPDDPYGMDQAQDRPGQTVIPGPLAQWAARNNQMKWGGDFQSRSPDPMHFELASNVPQAPMGMPMNVAVNGAAGAPITTGSVASAQPQGGGMAPAMAGGGFGNFIQGLAQNPAFLEGLMMLTQGTKYQPGSGAGIANSAHERVLKQLQLQRQERQDAEERRQFELNYGLRQGESALHQKQFGLQEKADTRAAADQRMQEETYQRGQKTYADTQRIWGEVYPNGQPNTSHPLLQGLKPEEAQTIYGMGPEAGLKLLGEMRMKGFTNREALEQQRQKLNMARDFVTGQPGTAPATAQQGPAVAPVAPGYQPMPTGGPRLQSAPQPQAGAPAVAPAPPPQSSAVRAMPEPTVDAGGGRKLTLGQAITEARILNLAGQRDEVLESGIKAAQKEAEVPPALKEQAFKTDQAYTDMSTSLDRYNKIIQKYPSGLGFIGKSADRDIARGERNNIILLAKDLYNLGQLSKADLDLAMSIPDPDIRMMPAPFSGDDAGLNFPGFGLADRTQKTIDAMKERIRSTRNIKGAIVGMPEIPAPQAKGDEKQAAPAVAKEKAPPKWGAIVEGYRFQGGNPADRKNWVKVQ